MTYLNTDWREGMQAASLEIDDKLGEDFLLIACKKRPNFDPEPDQANAPVQLRGVFSWRSTTVFTSGDGGSAMVESRKPIVSFSRNSLPWALQRSDRVQRLCDGTTFEITSVQPDGVSRVTCDLTQLGRQSQ